MQPANPRNIDNSPYAVRAEKPWGFELLFTPPEKPYVGKLLHVAAGTRLSLQLHDEKFETILLLSGRAQLQVDDEAGELITIDMLPHAGYHNVPGQRHRLVALEDSEFVESSTPETGTTYRLEDDAGRGDETEQMRRSDNRGWRPPLSK